MNRERAKELLPIIQAYAQGANVQASVDGEEWFDLDEPVFNGSARYRIKPEPREWWGVAGTYEDSDFFVVMKTEADAVSNADAEWKAIKVREVLDDE